MKINDRYKQALERAKESPAFWTEKALLDVARRFLVRMKEMGITQASLADKMGKKSPYISRLLSGKHNVTVETLSTAAHALGMKIEIRLEPIYQEKKSESINISMESVQPIRPARLRLVKSERKVVDAVRTYDTFTSGVGVSSRKAA